MIELLDWVMRLRFQNSESPDLDLMLALAGSAGFHFGWADTAVRMAFVVASDSSSHFVGRMDSSVAKEPDSAVAEPGNDGTGPRHVVNNRQYKRASRLRTH